MPQKQADAPLRPCPSADITQSFYNNMSPRSQSLVVIASTLALSLVFIFGTLKLTENKPTTDAINKPIIKKPDETPRYRQSVAEMLNYRLYGYSHPYSYRITEIIETGDVGLLSDFRTDFMSDFKVNFGSRINQNETENPSPQNILNFIIESLQKELRKAGIADENAIVGTIANHVCLALAPDGSERSHMWTETFETYLENNGTWHIRSERTWKEIEILREKRRQLNLTENSYREALRKIPESYAHYLTSLISGREANIVAINKLLELKDEERRPLEAIAKYRRARLTMSLEDWSSLTDRQTKERLAQIRDDLSAVPSHVNHGSLDPFLISHNAEYWIAYTRSILLPAERLIRLGEADFPGAFETYLRMPQCGEGNAVNSSYRLARKICADSAYSVCIGNEDLSRLVTLYLSAGGSNNASEMLSYDEARKACGIWLDELNRSHADLRFEAVRIALLQCRAERWTECLKTLKLAPAGDPLAALLRSRCNLRMNGDINTSLKLLDLTQSHEAPVAQANSSKAISLPEKLRDYTILIDLQERSNLVARAGGELAMCTLKKGDYVRALRLFETNGYAKEANYIGECVLSVDELKAAIDLDQPSNKREALPHMFWDEGITTTRKLLASRLFRVGRWDEAIQYLEPKLRVQAGTYVMLRRMGENEALDRRSRADAYWRAALIIGEIGEEILHAPFGLTWHSYDKQNDPNSRWQIPYSFLPDLRINHHQPEEDILPTQLFAPSANEIGRLKVWRAEHVDKPNRSERDARYETFSLTLKAALLLPVNDPAGGQILQYAGNLLKYREPKVANQAYRMLTSKFFDTPMGLAAAKSGWFAKDRITPPADVLKK